MSPITSPDPDCHRARVTRPGVPLLQVISGDASPEEVAAVLAVLAARSAAGQRGSAAGDAGGGRAEVWSARDRPPRRLGDLPGPGPDRWRTSYWPG